MMNNNFKRYNRIYSLLDNEWKPREETDGILKGICSIQEKIDWCNLSVWMKDWEIRVWSRNQEVTKDGFNWAVDYVTTHKGIKALLEGLEWEIRLYGEWLIPHTITDYITQAYSHFYLFDIEQDGEQLSTLEVNNLASKFSIKKPHFIGVINNPTIKELTFLVGKTWLKWDKKDWGEGIVIKNLDFVNKFWNTCYGKMVGDDFKENNSIVFGNHKKWDIEMKLATDFCNLARVKKIIGKIEHTLDRNIVKTDIEQIIWRIQYDIIVEEAWHIAKKWTISFNRLKSLIWRRTARIAIDIIEGNKESVAFSNAPQLNKKKEVVIIEEDLDYAAFKAFLDKDQPILPMMIK